MQKFDFNAISDMCVKCGKCKPNCTIFKISGDEVRSPRGFLDLIGAYNRGEMKLDKNAKSIFESCYRDFQLFEAGLYKLRGGLPCFATSG